MCAYHVTAPTAPYSAVHAWLTWVGGGERRELGERHERSAHAVAGVVVLTSVVLTWSVTTLAVLEATRLPGWVAAAFTAPFALLLGAISRSTVAGSTLGPARRGAITVGVSLSAIAGEFGALAILSGPIDHDLQHQAISNASSAPAVMQASGNLQQMRDARAALDRTVDVARTRRDEALVIARCEYHPTSACPQNVITGVPGPGPETRTANQILVDSQRELDYAVAARDHRAPELDAQIVDGERVLADSHKSIAADRGLGARWVTMQQLASRSLNIAILQALTVAFFVALALLPTNLRRWRGETTHDRHAQARAERERANLSADTAIALKQAEVRAATEIMWAEEQLVRARLAVEARTEIERAQLQREVNAAIEGTASHPTPAIEDVYLPIAAEAEAVSLGALPSVDVVATPPSAEVQNLPAIAETGNSPATPAIPTIPVVTRAAARWIRPLVPDFLARAVDTSVHPLRTVRQVIEEVEEITLSLKRTHKITVHAEESSAIAPGALTSGDNPANEFGPPAAPPSSARRLSPTDARPPWVLSSPGESQGELANRGGPAELRAQDGPRRLPPAE